MRIVKSIYHEFEKYHWTKKTIIILTFVEAASPGSHTLII